MWRVLFVLCISSQLAACVTPYTPWPEESGGGMAEKYPPGGEALVILKERYRLLLERRADQRMPSQMLLAQTLIIRALREQSGGLFIDAGQTAAAASAVLDSIEDVTTRSQRGVSARSE